MNRLILFVLFAIFILCGSSAPDVYAPAFSEADQYKFDETGESEVIAQEGNTTTDNIQEFDLSYSTETVEEVELYRVVDIDIKPGSEPNSINLRSKGVTPVAVLTDEFFDAEDVVVDSVVFAEASPAKGKLEDIDDDNDLDLILHFETQDLQLTSDSMEVTLTGQLTDGSSMPGWGGQEFKEWTLEKIKVLRGLWPNGNIEVDGGINPETAKKTIKAGANLICAGTYIFKSKDIKQAIKKLK